MEQKSIYYFFEKYHKLFKNLFKQYAGLLKNKYWHFGETNFNAKTMVHHSELWLMLKDFGYITNNTVQISPTKIATMIKDIKLENSQNIIKGELFVDFQEF